MTLPGAVRRALVRQARRARPLECCGLLVGRGRRIHHAVAAANLARSATRYTVDPRAHIDLRRVLRDFDPPLGIVGVYHSHPDGPAVPSAADVDAATYPDWLYLIVGLGGSRPEVRGWRIRRGRTREVALEGD